jgi:hypothetical protein
MNRFTTDRLKAAAEVTGFKFVNKTWVKEEDKCACGMSQLLMAECDIPAGKIIALDTAGDTLAVIMRRLDVPHSYALGFLHGFDSEKAGAYPAYYDVDETYRQGYQDGVNGRREFIDVQS